MITATVLIHGCDMEGVKCPAFQIWDAAGWGGGGAAGVVTAVCLGQHRVAGRSSRAVPDHPGSVGYAVQATLRFHGHTRSCGE